MSSWSQQFSRNRTCHRSGHRCHKFVTDSKEIPNVLRSIRRRRSNPIDRPQHRPATGGPSKRCFDEETDDVTDSVTSHRFCHKLWQPVTCDIYYVTNLWQCVTKSVTICDQICDMYDSLKNCWLHDAIWTTKNKFSKNRGTRIADRYNRKRSLYSDCWSDLHRVRENWHAVRIFSKKNLWQLWIWWDLINKNERYRVVVRFACEEAVSGGVYIRAISQTFSCRNCSSISNLWQICDRICDNYLTNLSVLVGEILRPNRYLKNTSLFEIM